MAGIAFEMLLKLCRETAPVASVTVPTGVVSTIVIAPPFLTAPYIPPGGIVIPPSIICSNATKNTADPAHLSFLLSPPAKIAT